MSGLALGTGIGGDAATLAIYAAGVALFVMWVCWGIGR